MCHLLNCFFGRHEWLDMEVVHIPWLDVEAWVSRDMCLWCTKGRVTGWYGGLAGLSPRGKQEAIAQLEDALGIGSA